MRVTLEKISRTRIDIKYPFEIVCKQSIKYKWYSYIYYKVSTYISFGLSRGMAYRHRYYMVTSNLEDYFIALVYS